MPFAYLFLIWTIKKLFHNFLLFNNRIKTKFPNKVCHLCFKQVIVAKYVERFFLDLDWMVQQVRGQYSGTCDKNHTRLLSTSNLHGKLRKTEG